MLGRDLPRPGGVERKLKVMGEVERGREVVAEA